MRILSVRVGFAPDHSTTTYRYTALDKATAESFRRGEDCYRKGAVVSLVQRVNVLRAEVEF